MPRCFVVTGFHKKTDLATGRVLDLDRSYAVIKEAVEAAGLECFRADEIRHSGTIDVPMFRELLEADLVIADLSTSNVNAAYELGVRHALRPARTIIVAENQFTAPFDVNRIAIWSYEHLGADIGNFEAQRIREELSQHIRELMAKDDPDSPVYQFLQHLEPPGQSEILAPRTGEDPTASHEGDVESSETVATLLAMAMEFKAAGNFSAAETALRKLVQDQPGEVYLRQQLALVTYKSEAPDKIAALERAKETLRELHPEETLDTETVGLWAAIQKRLWEEHREPPELDSAIRALEKIYGLKADWYNGINLAFLLDSRAAIADANEPGVDSLQAQLVRRRVIQVCNREVASRSDEFQLPIESRKKADLESQYWLLATLREASHGLGDSSQAEYWRAEAAGVDPEEWMVDSTNVQIAKLEELQVAGPSSDQT